MKRFFTKQLGYLLFGFIVWLPIALLIVLGLWAFQSVEGVARDILDFFPFGESFPPGTGFLAIVLLVYISGVLLGKTVISNFAAKIPVLGIFLGQKNGKVMSLGKLLNLQPCLFLFSPTCPSYGFILSEEKVALDGEEAPYTLLHIYYPNVPTIILGQVYPIRKEETIKIANHPREVINLLLYASRSPVNINYLPWENETKEEFKERANNFGLYLNIKAPGQ